MARIVKVVKTLRNNWKKSVVGAVALTYGVNYALQSYEHKQMMRAYCEAAKEIGETPMPPEARPRHVTVILNPAANKRKAKKEFENYCAPLLHLAGLSVNLLVTVKEGQARTLIEKLDEATDAIVVAGGDGTLSEAVTGLFRRQDATSIASKIPMGILPLGKTNSVAKKLFSQSADDHIKQLAEATMAVILEVTKPLDVIKFQVIPNNTNEERKPPVYGLVGLEWGAFRDAIARRDKYWYFGGLRGYASYLFTGLKDEKSGVTWQVQASVEYSPPCEGCSNCYSQRIDLQPDPTETKSWWSTFRKRPLGPTTPKVDYRGKLNESCSLIQKVDLKTVDFSLLSSNVVDADNKVPQLHVSYGPEQSSYEDFVREGWHRENGGTPHRPKIISTKDLKMWPIGQIVESKDAKTDAGAENVKGTGISQVERWISIDNEDYEIKAIHATLLPNLIKIFCPQQLK